jgi:pyruvate formate lyase activating enzyme
MYDQRLCRKFKDCLKPGLSGITVLNGNIRINRTELKDLQDLKETCISKAMTVVGEELDTVEIIAEIEKDLPFYMKSGGGVTLSGGEPLSQNGPFTGLLEEIRKKQIHISIETSLHVGWKQIERCLGKIDCFLVDLKHIDEKKFYQFTGGDLHIVLNNLKKLDASGEHIIIRIPVIPGFNHTRREMYRMIDYSGSLNGIREIHFIPYHTLGKEKYQMLGMDYAYSVYKSVPESEILPYMEYAKQKGFLTKIGG